MENQKPSLVVDVLEQQLERHFQAMLSDENRMKKIRNEFRRDGYFNFKDFSFLPRKVLESVHEEVHELLDEYSVRRDVTVPSTGNTYRKMYNVNQPEIAEGGTLIPALYQSKALRNFLGNIAGDDLASCWEQEQYLITKLSHPGDTHGWHWGDYPYTMIWIIEAPEDPAIGGVLQCVPHSEWDKQNPQIWQYILNNDIKSYHHLKGDVYFLKSDTTLHHVAPIQQETTRIILNTCWASAHDRRTDVAHESIDVIWGTEARTAEAEEA
ncbi:HalD/BesD family halogenase [Pseudomonas defluvii]|uniref:HalD/BesD family halogenase n=1 Tax=Pseudomonas defluvii TaxID=1876757 RepID=UPI0008113F94|nr:hypothetical protein [Pseudomonas defluvii]